MIRKLLIVAAGGLVVSVACLAGATALVSHDLGAKGWNWSVVHDGDHVRFLKGAAAKPEPTLNKTLAWAGSDTLNLDLPADVDYSQGATASVTLSGPQALVDRVRIDGDRLYMAPGENAREGVDFTIGPDGVDAHKAEGTLKVAIVAPAVSSFELGGNGDLSLHGYNQPKLNIVLSGQGDVDATGTTGALKLILSGRGSADLSSLKAKDADINVSGDGDSDVNASGNAQVTVSGNGDVRFTTRPAVLNSNITGNGSVE